MISVIIPAHNEERFIRKCIDSIRQQRYKDYEIIVVCDSCSDKTYQISKRLGVRAYRVNYHNVSAARNHGAKNAKGDIFLFLDADCIIVDNLLQKVADLVDKGYVGGTCKTKTIEGGVRHRLAWIIGNLSKRFVLTASGMMFCTSDAFPGFNTKFTVAEETHFLDMLKKRGKVKFMADTYIKTSARRFKRVGYIRTSYAVCMSYFFRRNFKYEIVR